MLAYFVVGSSRQIPQMAILTLYKISTGAWNEEKLLLVTKTQLLSVKALCLRNKAKITKAWNFCEGMGCHIFYNIYWEKGKEVQNCKPFWLLLMLTSHLLEICKHSLLGSLVVVLFLPPVCSSAKPLQIILTWNWLRANSACTQQIMHFIYQSQLS